MRNVANILYKVFHSDKDTDREHLLRGANHILQFIGKELDTPTVLISGPRSLKKFLNENPDFNVDLKGYDPRKYMDSRSRFVGAICRVGWRYGELGVWASNWLSWKNFLNTDADYLILAEDDIVLIDECKTLLDLYVEHLPEGWDQFHLWAPTGDRPLYDPNKHGVGNMYVAKAYQNWSNTAYMLSRSGAQKLLDDVKKRGIKLPLDWLWFQESAEFDFNCYTITPQSTHLCYNSEEVGSTFQWQMRREDLTNYDSHL
jgi:GR25 family glycosyltransferase involved in LPS biosynthesis